MGALWCSYVFNLLVASSLVLVHWWFVAGSGGLRVGGVYHVVYCLSGLFVFRFLQFLVSSCCLIVCIGGFVGYVFCFPFLDCLCELFASLVGAIVF